jgi:N-acetylglucosaminyl-diphospho-decaprenol L-rhamnosyltransferase
MRDLSVVIITWKMKELLGPLLRSIDEYTEGIDYDVIVVDNCSDDGTVEMIESEFPTVTLIKNNTNRGVAAARNQGLRIAEGRYVQLLDADMLLLENSFKAMVNFMDETPDAGVCGSKLIYPNGDIQLNCRRFPRVSVHLLRRLEFLPVARNSEALRLHTMTDWEHDEIRQVDYLIGACQMIRREALEEVGLLDEHIFYGPEDLDFCLRSHQRGWNVYYFPHTKMIHYEQRVTKKKYLSTLSFKHLFGVFYLYWKYQGKLTVDGDVQSQRKVYTSSR